MALIKSQLVLSDGMTGPLKNITKALNLVINTMGSMQDGLARPIDTASLQTAREELARVNGQLDQLERQANDTGSALGNLAKSAGLLMLARKAFDVIKSGVDYASDLAEVQNVVDVTFGSSAADIDAWSKKCLDAYGMNEVSAKRYAGTLGAMLKSSGVAKGAVTDMSKALTGLAGDMASFYNSDLETAFEKIRSGISGETEPLKQWGIKMSVANLEAYALSQGIKKSYNKMSQAEQVLLRYNYLLSATADAQGDYVRTNDSWANQVRKLSEAWTTFAGTLAEKLLPALTTIVTWLNGVLAWLTENSDTVSAVLVGLAGAAGVLAVAWAYNAITTWAAKAAADGLFASLLSNPVVWIALIVGVLIGMMYRWIQSIGGVQNAWEICKLALALGWNWVKMVFFTGVCFVIDLLDKLKLGWQKAGVAIANFMGDMKVSVLTILQNMVNGAIDIINGFISLLNKIPGVSIDAIEHVTFATTAAAENEAAKTARAEDLAATEAQMAAAKAERDAWLDSLRAEVASSADALEAAKAKARADAQADNSAALEEIGADTASISDSAGSAASSLKATTEDLKYLRDLAEQEAINRFTTAEVKIDMTGMTNRIDSDMDLDGVLSTLTDGFAEALEIAAEGVHE